MVPWQECPHVAVSLGGGYADVAIDAALLAAARRLLGEIQKEIPFYARPLAYAVHARTKCLFLREARAVARRAAADWRDITLANLMYDVVVSRFGCSTIALATPEGP